VPDIVSFRCDFPAWLETLRHRDRRIAETLALGHRTQDVARRFQVSEGRVSQLRRELAVSWKAFVGEVEGNADA
jgi:FixJ family two-component response regulator